jgi:hypothetical protein
MSKVAELFGHYRAEDIDWRRIVEQRCPFREDMHKSSKEPAWPELTGKRRNWLFSYDRYLAILNEGTEAP